MLTLVSFIDKRERARRGEIRNEAAARRLAADVFLICARNGRQPTCAIEDENRRVISKGEPRGLRLAWASVETA